MNFVSRWRAKLKIALSFSKRLTAFLGLLFLNIVGQFCVGVIGACLFSLLLLLLLSFR